MLLFNLDVYLFSNAAQVSSILFQKTLFYSQFHNSLSLLSVRTYRLEISRELWHGLYYRRGAEFQPRQDALDHLTDPDNQQQQQPQLQLQDHQLHQQQQIQSNKVI